MVAYKNAAQLEKWLSLFLDVIVRSLKDCKAKSFSNDRLIGIFLSSFEEKFVMMRKGAVASQNIKGYLYAKRLLF